LSHVCLTGQEAMRRRPRPAPDGRDLADGLAGVRVCREPRERLLFREFGAFERQFGAFEHGHHCTHAGSLAPSHGSRGGGELSLSSSRFTIARTRAVSGAREIFAAVFPFPLRLPTTQPSPTTPPPTCGQGATFLLPPGKYKCCTGVTVGAAF